MLQIRLQRRKRVGNRPLGGYKTLAIGKVDMSQVLQHSFQGEVKLVSEKVSEHLATVTVRSLSSTAVALDRRTNEGTSTYGSSTKIILVDGPRPSSFWHGSVQLCSSFLTLVANK